MDLCRTSDLKFNPMDSSHFESNFKRTINCPTTLVNMNEPSEQMAYWRYHCSVTYFTQQWRSYHENFSFIVTYHDVTGQRQCQSEWKQMEISVTQASNGFIHSEEEITDDLGRPCNSLFQFQVVHRYVFIVVYFCLI